MLAANLFKRFMQFDMNNFFVVLLAPTRPKMQQKWWPDHSDTCAENPQSSPTNLREVIVLAEHSEVIWQMRVTDTYFFWIDILYVIKNMQVGGGIYGMQLVHLFYVFSTIEYFWIWGVFNMYFFIRIHMLLFFLSAYIYACWFDHYILYDLLALSGV